ATSPTCRYTLGPLSLGHEIEPGPSATQRPALTSWVKTAPALGRPSSPTVGPVAVRTATSLQRCPSASPVARTATGTDRRSWDAPFVPDRESRGEGSRNETPAPGAHELELVGARRHRGPSHAEPPTPARNGGPDHGALRRDDPTDGPAVVPWAAAVEQPTADRERSVQRAAPGDRGPLARHIQRQRRERDHAVMHVSTRATGDAVPAPRQE